MRFLALVHPEGEAAELTQIGISPSIFGTVSIASRLGVCGASQRSAVRATAALDTRASTFAYFLISAAASVAVFAAPMEFTASTGASLAGCFFVAC